MTRFILLILTVLSMQSFANTTWQKLATGLYYTEIETNKLGGRLHAFKISTNNYQFKIDLAANHKQDNLTIKSFVKRNNALIGINGGFFDPNWHPLGLRRINNQNKVRFKDITWWGVAAFKDNELSILSPRDYLNQSSQYDNALQSGPRLVIEGNIPKLKPGIAERSALCAKPHEVIIAIANNHPVEITQFAKILAAPENKNGLACMNALNLDGGSSSQLYSQLQNKKLFLAGLSQITDALLVIAK